MFYEEAVQLNVDGSINYMHPFSFEAQTAGNNVFHFHQDMQEDDREGFIKAMIKELEDHRSNNQHNQYRLQSSFPTGGNRCDDRVRVSCFSNYEKIL